MARRNPTAQLRGPRGEDHGKVEISPDVPIELPIGNDVYALESVLPITYRWCRTETPEAVA